VTSFDTSLQRRHSEIRGSEKDNSQPHSPAF
jgi:hypothetical protein